jgi:hypothetical protein
MGARLKVGVSFARVDGRDSAEMEVRALMKVLIGVDPHKASVAVAVVDEAVGPEQCRTACLECLYGSLGPDLQVAEPSAD